MLPCWGLCYIGWSRSASCLHCSVITCTECSGGVTGRDTDAVTDCVCVLIKGPLYRIQYSKGVFFSPGSGGQRSDIDCDLMVAINIRRRQLKVVT